MTMERLFFDWTHPDFLSKVAEEIVRRYRRDRRLDLSSVVLVTPGKGARRRLNSALLGYVERLIALDELDPDWTPPDYKPLGAFPEALYARARSVAGPCVATFLWRYALSEKPECLGRFLAMPEYRFPDDFSRQLQLARIPEQLHTALAPEGYTFGTVETVLRKSTGPDMAAEADRWSALAEVQKRYMELLEKSGLCDIQLERIAALRHGECATDREFYLVGIVELSGVQKKLLDAVADHVHCFVYAPESRMSFFDSYGCVDPKSWESAGLELSGHSIVQCAKTTDMVEPIVRRIEQAAAECLKQEGDAAGAFDRLRKRLAVCIPDDVAADVVPGLRARLEKCGISLTTSTGEPATRNRVYRVLAPLAEWCEKRLFSSLATLVRQPDVERYISRQLAATPEVGPCDWLSLLDRYARELIPYRQDTLSNVRIPSKSDAPYAVDYAPLGSVLKILAKLLEPLDVETERNAGESEESSGREESGGSNESSGLLDVESLQEIFASSTLVRRIERKGVYTAAEWCERLSRFLSALYSERLAEPVDEANEMACRERHQIETGIRCVNGVFDRLAEIPEAYSPKLADAEALRLLLDVMAKEQLEPYRKPREMEAVGWLELRLDEAGDAIVAGVNEGMIPAATGPARFMGEAVGNLPGLDERTRRYARDLYTLSAVMASRPNTTLLTARVSGNKDVLQPSRFLFLDSRHLVERVQRLFGDKVDFDGTPDRREDGATAASALTLPVLKMSEPEPVKWSATKFRDFIASPYCFFLRHGLKLETLRDDMEEQDVMMFGTLVHAVLAAFGKSKMRDSDDAGAICSYLSERLDAERDRQFGGNTSPAVLVQIEHMRNIMRHFSQWQAKWRELGNEILWVEKSPKQGCVVDARGTCVSGSIDRIDYNRDTKTLYVFDYKTLLKITFGKSGERRALYSKSGRTLLLCAAPGNSIDDKCQKDTSTTPATAPLWGWLDPQLPVYRHLAANILREEARDDIAPNPNMELAYIVLKKNTPVVAFAAPWDDNKLGQADAAVKWIVETVHRLWQTEIKPDELIDPDYPELGTIWDRNVKTFGDFQPITGAKKEEY